MIECKRCSHDESKEVFEKLINSMSFVYKDHQSYVVGILIVGQAIVV